MSAIIVELPPAVSANLYWRTRVVKGIAMTYVSAEAKAFKSEVARRMRIAGVTAPIEGRVVIELTMYPHRPQDWLKRCQKLGNRWDDSVRSIDLDNAMKVTLDALKGIAIVDDGWPVRRITAERAVPDGEARMIVKITPVDADPAPQQTLF